MSMTTQFTESSLFYTEDGKEEHILFLFHRFGHDHTAFDSIRTELKQHYTLYSFDLYFHGKSFWANGEDPISKEALKKTIEQILREKNISRFSMAGYSIGAKFLLTTLEAFPDQVNELYLIAPDGIKTSFWYSLATQTKFFRKIFKGIMARPEKLFALLNGIQKLGILPKDLIQFIRLQMKSPQQRQQIYLSWVAFRKLQVSVQKIAEIINRFQIPVHMLIGKKDRLITEKKVAPLLRQLHHYTLDIEDISHHQLLKKEPLQKLFDKK